MDEVPELVLNEFNQEEEEEEIDDKCDKKKVPVTIITGFLGIFKTYLH